MSSIFIKNNPKRHHVIQITFKNPSNNHQNNKKMKKAISLLILVLLILSSCSKRENICPKQLYPDCINSNIQVILQSPVQSIKATVKKYLYQGQTVYLISTNFPDAPSQVYNEKCDLICSIGGIGGETSTTCINWNNATFLETVWTDPR